MSILPPRPKGPPLNALRAFEAAARLGGFAAAADELCVTAGAVAQHIKALEAWAGAALFERRSQGVELTVLGAGLCSEFTAAFDHMGEAVLSLRARATPQHIRIAALPSVAQLWLSPRLPAIRMAASDVTVSVTAMETRPNLKREPFDMSIFYDGEKSSPDSIMIAADVIFPVCAPQLAGRLKTPADLACLPLLHDAAWRDDWDIWLKAVGDGAAMAISGPVFSLYSLAVEEAKNGAGVLMGHEALVRDHLTNGQLVAPFTEAVTLKRALTVEVAYPLEDNQTLNGIVAALVDGRR